MEDSLHLRYLIVSEKDMQWGLSVNTVGFQNIKGREVYPPQNHPHSYLFSKEKGRILKEYQLLYIVRGKGTFSSAHCKKTSISEGHMLLLFPGEWHTYYPNEDEGWMEYWIGFIGMNIDNRVEAKFFNRENPIFDVGMNNKLIDLYKEAIDIAASQKFGFQILLAGVVNHLLGYAFALGKNSSFESSEQDVVMNKARSYIFKHIYEQIYPEDIAEYLNISYSSFRRLFKNYTGFSPATYILEQKINKCKELLTNSNYHSGEIAFRMGFESPDYFCTVFKRKTGMTPLEYRNFTQGKVYDIFK